MNWLDLYLIKKTKQDKDNWKKEGDKIKTCDKSFYVKEKILVNVNTGEVKIK